MGSQAFSVTAESAAPPERVFQVLADTQQWARWAPFDESGLERKGDPAPNGLGAVRRFRRGRIRTREEVVAYEPPRHFAYTLLSGLPIHGYRADVTLERRGCGTVITWASSFDPAVPGTGWLLRRILRNFVAQVAVRLARRAEAEATER